MKNKYYIGLDVHKETISIAYALGSTREEAVYHGKCAGSNRSVVEALRKLAKKLGVAFKELSVCYEAGGCGFVLARHLESLGLECAIMAPRKAERKPNEKIKTDKRDACKIARLFRNGDITSVRVPPALDEAVRDLARARTDASRDLRRSRQRLKAFLLRNGIRYKGSANWSPSHMNYLRGLKMPSASQSFVLEEYIQAIETGTKRLERHVERMKEVLKDWEWKPVVEALMCLRGFQVVSAMTVVSELGDLRRFAHPKQTAAFVGLVPSEATTSDRRRQGAITKSGNTHARWILVESAQHYRLAPKVSAELGKRQKGAPRKVLELSWRAQNRLHDRYRRLKARKKTENKIIVALARELCAFLWELQNKTGLSMPGEEVPSAT